jgi:hypothetical protein
MKGLGSEVLDFDVHLETPFLVTEGGARKEVEQARVVVRDDSNEILSVVSKDYVLVPHKTVAEAVDSALERANLEIADERITTHLNPSGTQFYRTYHFPDIAQPVEKGDLVGMAIRITNSYDRTSRIGIYLDGNRLVCTNGLIQPKNEFSITLVHVGDFDPDKFSLSADSLIHKFDILTNKWRAWAEQGLEHERAQLVIEHMALKHHMRWIADRVLQGSHPMNTRWQAYNAVTEVITHDYHGTRSNAPEFRRVQIGELATKTFDDDKLFTVDMDDLKEMNRQLEEKNRRTGDGADRISSALESMDRDQNPRLYDLFSQMRDLGIKKLDL